MHGVGSGNVPPVSGSGWVLLLQTFIQEHASSSWLGARESGERRSLPGAGREDPEEGLVIPGFIGARVHLSAASQTRGDPRGVAGCHACRSSRAASPCRAYPFSSLVGTAVGSQCPSQGNWTDVVSTLLRPCKSGECSRSRHRLRRFPSCLHFLPEARCFS